MRNLVNNFFDKFVNQLIEIVLSNLRVGIKPQLTQFDVNRTKLNYCKAQIDITKLNRYSTFGTSQVLNDNLIVINRAVGGILHSSIYDILVYGIHNTVSKVVKAFILQFPNGVNGFHNYIVVHCFCQIHRESCHTFVISQGNLLSVNGDRLNCFAGNRSKLEVVCSVTNNGIQTGGRIPTLCRSRIVGHINGSTGNGNLHGCIIGDILNRNILESLSTRLVFGRTVVGHDNLCESTICLNRNRVINLVFNFDQISVSQDSQSHSLLQVFDQLIFADVLYLSRRNFTLYTGSGALINQGRLCLNRQRIICFVVLGRIPSDTNDDFLSVIQCQQGFLADCFPRIVDQVRGELYSECAAVSSQEVRSILFAQDGVDHILCRRNLGFIVGAALIHFHLELTALSLFQFQNVILSNNFVLSIGIDIKGN